MAGVRAFGSGLKELRIHLCQKSPASGGVRDFIESHYVSMKQKNPNLPILVRECSGVSPKLHARYEYGRENSIDLSNMPKEEVIETLNHLAGAGPQGL